MKHVLLIGFFSFLLFANAQTPDFSKPYGYASMNGGTTGGQGGPTVTPTNFTELQNYVAGTDPYIILIDREFKGPNVLRMGSNKTLLGVGTKGFINQIGVSIQCQHNIIIRNIRFTMKDVPITHDGENKIEGFNFDPDCIAIQADDENLPESERKSYNIWVDHCEFYNEDPNVMTNVDRYDGLVDVKNDCQYITISWNYFHDHHKGCLSGKGNSDDYDRKTTMHHNKFENIHSRAPLFRYGKLHMLNNYMTDCPDGNGINVRINSQAYVEKNYFDNVKKPIFGKLSENGTAHLVDNVFKNCGRLPANQITSLSPDADPLSDSETFKDNNYIPPYLYSGISVPVNNVPAHVNQYVGIGKITVDVTPSNIPPSVSITSPANNASFDAPVTISIEANATDADGNVSNVKFYNGTTLLATDNNAPYMYTWSNVEQGIYTITAIATDNKSATKTSSVIQIIVNPPTNMDCNGQVDGSAYLDNCGVCVGGNTIRLACEGEVQGEAACTIDGVQLESTNEGFYGNGYVNTDNAVGASVSWGLTSEITQNASLTFRYANGGTAARNGIISINGNPVGEAIFETTGAWTAWDLFTINLSLVSGSNELLIEANGAEGLANIDVVYFSTGVSDAGCTITGASANVKGKIHVYPNPTQATVNLSKESTWSLHNALGSRINHGISSSVDMSNQQAGIYFLKVNHQVVKLIKE